jgi:hypothetical protein
MNKPITVYSNNGIVSIDSNEERLVTIYNISGQLVKRFKMQGERKISLREGIYIIKAGDFVTKLRVE